eukprot:UN24821
MVQDPVPWYRVRPNYARIVKPFYEVIYDMGFFREFCQKVIGSYFWINFSLLLQSRKVL